jgi:hypothetical protein
VNQRDSKDNQYDPRITEDSINKGIEDSINIQINNDHLSSGRSKNKTVIVGPENHQFTQSSGNHNFGSKGDLLQMSVESLGH